MDNPEELDSEKIIDLAKAMKLPDNWERRLNTMWEEEGKIERPIKGIISEEQLQANADFVAMFVMFEMIYRRKGFSQAKKFLRSQMKIYKSLASFVNLQDFASQAVSSKLAKYNNDNLIQKFINAIEEYNV